MGHNRGRAEDARLLRGQGRYTADIAAPGAVEAVFLRAPHAHARIVSLDATQARAMPGVVLVLTGADALAAGLGIAGPRLRRKLADGSPMVVPPAPPLTADFARFAGDPVALVLAETRAQAEDAAEAIMVDWEELEAVTDTWAASLPGAPQVWPQVPGNTVYEWSAGDRAATDAALAAAAHVTQLRLPISRTTAFAMEPRAVLADFDAGTGVYHLTAGLQSPWQVRDLLAAEMLHVPASQIEVTSPDVGGSFGMKGQTFAEYGALLHAARLAGRQVRWVSTRSEALLSEDQGRDVVMTGWLGLDADGRITAIRMEGVTALGAYLSTRGTLTTVDNVAGICGTYRVPAAHAQMRAVHSHTPAISPYRGAGRPEASMLIERLMDIAAQETGRDPVALRRINMLTQDELPYLNPLGFEYDCGDFPGALDKVLEIGDHTGFAARKAESAARGLWRGQSVVSIVARSAAGQYEMARMTLQPGGAILLESGAVSQGQGHETVFAQIAADVLEIAPEAVTYDSGQSTLFEAAIGTFGSRSAGIAGPAVQAAAHALIIALRPHAARLLNSGADDLTFAEGAFGAPGGARVTLDAIAQSLDAPVSATERYAPQAATFPNGAHLCEVEVDPETGAVRVDRYAVVEDVGHVLHPAIVKGQVHGGIVQGLAQVMAEQIAYDPDSGQLQTGSLMDFAVPRASDMPFFAVKSHPVPTQRNPLGVKGAGEGGTIGALPAYQNAIADALRPLGVREIPMPATSSAIWHLIRDHSERAE